MPAKTFYFDLEISLMGIEPPIWRRFLIRKNCNFHELHDTIQKACGWLDSHLYEFRSYSGREPSKRGEVIASSPYTEPFDIDEIVPDARQIPIDGLFWASTGEKCIYIYDFGDNWEHLIELKDIKQLPGTTRRHLIGGERAFPPEDCGGTYGYEECLQAFVLSPLEIEEIEDVMESEERRSMKEWLGDWHPEHFDFGAVAKELKRPVRYP